MAKLAAFSIRMQHDIPIIFMVISVIFSLIFAYVIWTQFEIIRQYAAKWRLLGQGEETTVIQPVETPAQPIAPPVLTVAPPELPAEEPVKPVQDLQRL